MGDWLKRKIIGVGLGILGLAGWLGYHSLVGDGGSRKEINKIPEKVFAGGGGELSVSINMNKPGYLATSFARGEEDNEDEEDAIHAREELVEGDHNFKIDLPADLSYGYFELEIPDAPVGARLNWTVQFEGREILKENEELGQPLGENQAFFLQLEFSDLDELRRIGERETSGNDDRDENAE